MVKNPGGEYIETSTRNLGNAGLVPEEVWGTKHVGCSNFQYSLQLFINWLQTSKTFLNLETLPIWELNSVPPFEVMLISLTLKNKRMAMDEKGPSSKTF